MLRFFQFIGWLQSKHPKFTVTGSFDNPAEFDWEANVDTPKVRFWILGYFFGYAHNGGGAVFSGSKIDFTANGDIILKLIWQGIEFKRVPVQSTGYYDTKSHVGKITNM